jgi:DNA-binding transcriptional regulator YdaS (Cro superfamily)
VVISIQELDMRLDDYIRKSGKKRKEFAEEIGVAYWSLLRYLNGERIPAPEKMNKIKEVTGGKVQPNDFYETSLGRS